MKFTIENNFSQNIYTLLRRSGYMPIHDRKSGKNSFIKKLTSGRYPRFHLYVTETKELAVFDLHLDQNVNRYQGQTAHNADYDSEQVKNELALIHNTIIKYKADASQIAAAQSPSVLDIGQKKPASKKSWLKKLFG